MIDNIEIQRAIAQAARDESAKQAKVDVLRGHTVQLRQHIELAIKQAESAYRAKYPDASGIGISAKVFSYRKRPKAYWRYPLWIVEGFIVDRKTLKWSNARLAELVGEHYGFKAPASLMTEKLSPAQKRKLLEIVTGRGTAIDLSQHDTVSKIKAALLARYAGEKAISCFKGTVAFTDDAVIVNDKRRVIQKTNKGLRIHVGKQWLNVDRLKELLISE